MRVRMAAMAIALALTAGCTAAPHAPTGAPEQPPPATSPAFTGFTGFTFRTDREGWAVTSGGRILRTADGGATWQTVHSGLPVRLTQIFRAGPDGLVAVGQSLCTQPCTGEGVIVRSQDGQTWHATRPDGLEGERLNQAWPFLRFAFPTAETGYATIDPDMPGGFGPLEGLGHALLKTTDGGQTWGMVTLPEGHRSTGGIAFVSDTEGYLTASTGGGYTVLKTADGGATWTPVLNTTVPLYALSFYDGEVGLAAGGFPAKSEKQPRQAVWLTEDGGQTWHLVYQGQEGQPFDGLWLVSPSRGFATSGVCTMGANMPCAGPLYTTTTAGRSWDRVEGTKRVARFAGGYPFGWYGEGEEGPVTPFRAFDP